MAKSRVTSSLYNSGQNISYLCVLLGAAGCRLSASNAAWGRLCWRVLSSSHRTWTDICPGGACLFLLEPYRFLLSFLFVQTEVSKGDSHGPCKCPYLMTWAGTRLLEATCRKVSKGGGHGNLLRTGQEGDKQGQWSAYGGQRCIIHMLSLCCGNLCITPDSTFPSLNLHFLRWKCR